MLGNPLNRGSIPQLMRTFLNFSILYFVWIVVGFAQGQNPHFVLGWYGGGYAWRQRLWHCPVRHIEHLFGSVHNIGHDVLYYYFASSKWEEVLTMTNEAKLLEMVRSSNNPELAITEAIKVILCFLTQPQQPAAPFPALPVQQSETD